jgi:hypothetical protein
MRLTAFLSFECLHDARWPAGGAIPIRAQDDIDDVDDDDDVDELGDEDEEDTDEDEAEDDEDEIDDDELDEGDGTDQQATSEKAEADARNLEAHSAPEGFITSAERSPYHRFRIPAGVLRLTPDATT